MLFVAAYNPLISGLTQIQMKMMYKQMLNLRTFGFFVQRSENCSVKLIKKSFSFIKNVLANSFKIALSVRIIFDSPKIIINFVHSRVKTAHTPNIDVLHDSFGASYVLVCILPSSLIFHFTSFSQFFIAFYAARVCVCCLF